MNSETIENYMETIAKVEKEDISNMSFTKDEVLNDVELKTRRKVNLSKATTLGNGQKAKVKIIFQLENGEKKMVETTVWAVGQDYVTLKAGTLIPIHAISEVEL